MAVLSMVHEIPNQSLRFFVSPTDSLTLPSSQSLSSGKTIWSSLTAYPYAIADWGCSAFLHGCDSIFLFLF